MRAMIAPFLALSVFEPRNDERHRPPASGSGMKDPQARCAGSACPCGQRAARRCRACPGRCASRFSAGMKFRVRMLCRRSASLTSRTRASSAMASSSLRKFSACWACLVTKSSLLELGQAVDQAADLLAEHLVDLIAGDGGVLDRVVQHRGDDGRIVELELGQDGGDFERVREVGIAGGALLAAVRLHREHIGAIEHVLVGAGIVAPDPFHQLVLPHHRRKVSTLSNAESPSPERPRGRSRFGWIARARRAAGEGGTRVLPCAFRRLTQSSAAGAGRARTKWLGWARGSNAESPNRGPIGRSPCLQGKELGRSAFGPV